MQDEATAENLVYQLAPIHWAAIALAALLLAIGLRLIFKKPPTHLTAFSGEAGKVLVSRKALQELIKQACLLDDWVEAARPVVRVKGDKVSALVELRLSSPEHLKDVCERVQQRIGGLLQKSLSFEQIGDIQIVVKSFSSSTEPRKADEPAALLEKTSQLSPLSASPSASATKTPKGEIPQDPEPMVPPSIAEAPAEPAQPITPEESAEPEGTVEHPSQAEPDEKRDS